MNSTALWRFNRADASPPPTRGNRPRNRRARGRWVHAREPRNGHGQDGLAARRRGTARDRRLRRVEPVPLTQQKVEPEVSSRPRDFHDARGANSCAYLTLSPLVRVRRSRAPPVRTAGRVMSARILTQWLRRRRSYDCTRREHSWRGPVRHASGWVYSPTTLE